MKPPAMRALSATSSQIKLKQENPFKFTLKMIGEKDMDR